MMKPLTTILILAIMVSGCNRAASSALPTEPVVNFPTVSAEALPLCSPKDLETSSNSNEAAGTLVMGVTLINKSKNLCTLTNPPEVDLLDAKKKDLDIQKVAGTPAQTPPAPALQQLNPGDSVILSLAWSNYCQPLSNGTIVLRLNLTKDQNLDIDMDVSTPPGCDAKNQPSKLTTTSYSVPP